MGLFFVYVDETGYTEQLSKTPKKDDHLFEFGVTFVRADDGTQLTIERQLTVLQHRISKEMGSKRAIKLHATDLYQGRKEYKDVSSEKRYEWFQEVLKIGLQPKGVLYDSYLLDAKLDVEQHRNAGQMLKPSFQSPKLRKQSEDYQKHHHDKRTMYERNFLEFLLYCEKRLNQLNHYGLLIFDQRAESKKFVPSDVYRFLRAAGFLRHILEVPVFAEARYHPLLALADFTTYVRQGVRRDDLSGKNRPKFQEWLQNYVAPLMLSKLSFLQNSNDQDRNMILSFLYGLCFSVNRPSHDPAIDINELYPILSQTPNKLQMFDEVMRLIDEKSFEV